MPVRYRATGTFELVSSTGDTAGLWDMFLVTVIEGAVANAVAGGPSESEGIENVTLILDTVTATDSLTGLSVILSGSWELPFTGNVLEGNFVANRALDGDFGTAWQRLQQTGLDLLTSIDGLSDDDLLEVTRMGYRSGAFVAADLAYPFEIALAFPMTAALTEGDLRTMEYWLPVALEP